MSPQEVFAIFPIPWIFHPMINRDMSGCTNPGRVDGYWIQPVRDECA